MMRKKSQKANYDRPTTVIGKDTLIETGKIESKQSVQVNGRVVADVEVSASLVVGQIGHVEGDIHAAFVLVAGKIVGNVVVSQQIHLTKTAIVVGDIECQSIVIDDGAKIEGSFHMREAADAKAEA